MVCVALLVSVITLTIAYAVLSTTLTIKGSAKINSATWNINITAGNDFTTYGSAKFGYPTIESTTISGMKVDFYQPISNQFHLLRDSLQKIFQLS